jgi:hypothetical protein
MAGSIKPPKKLIEVALPLDDINAAAARGRPSARSWRETCELNKGEPGFDTEQLPAFHEPFAGGGSIPLEAQRLGLETILDLPDKACRLRIVLCNEGPDIGEALFCGLRYAEGSELCNCCFPFLIMRSASKLLTRPASISAKPSRTFARSSASA